MLVDADFPGGRVRRSLVMVLVALLALPALAAASPRDVFQREPASSPSARLQLEGSGVIRLEGRLVTFGLLPKRAQLWVRDYAGDAEFFLDGDERRLRSNGVTRLRGSGRFYLSGSRVMLQIRADNVSLSAAGRGWARVSGKGEYELNEGTERPWETASERPRRLALVPEEPGPGDGDDPA